MSLVEYLSRLSSAETSWGIWVNPKNLDDFRIGQIIFPGGGKEDGKVFIGTLESLSPCVSFMEALEHVLEQRIVYKNKIVKVNKKAVIESYDRLDEEFRNFLEEEAQFIMEIWATNLAEAKVEELEEFFSPGGEWEQIQEENEHMRKAFETLMEEKRKEYEERLEIESREY